MGWIPGPREGSSTIYSLCIIVECGTCRSEGYSISECMKKISERDILNITFRRECETKKQAGLNGYSISVRIGNKYDL